MHAISPAMSPSPRIATCDVAAPFRATPARA
jgi:hypothetical protein